MSFIEVENVSKEFKIGKRDKGFRNSIKALFHPEYEIKKAVNNISFSVGKGELVGYIGPNGAGKSTTIKMLSGILLPTSGTITVDGRSPHENRQENAMRIGIVFGQRSQLFWDLPMEETFDLYRKMYRVEEARFKRNVDFYVELLGMQDFLRTPVRQLSLGQKMRANISLALLHDPDIVYLDEPTIGLDVVAKDRIRHFIREINREKKTTVILTTHDMDDIEQICSRLIMIDMGQVIYDGSLNEFKDKYAGESTIIAEFAQDDAGTMDSRFRIFREEGRKKWITFKKDEVSIAEAVTYITRNYTIMDFHIEEPDIEEIVRGIYEMRIKTNSKSA